MNAQINQQSTDNQGTIIGKINLDSKVPCRRATCNNMIHKLKADKLDGLCGDCFMIPIKKDKYGFIAAKMLFVFLVCVVVIVFSELFFDRAFGYVVMISIIAFLTYYGWILDKADQREANKMPKDLTDEEIKKLTID